MVKRCFFGAHGVMLGARREKLQTAIGREVENAHLFHTTSLSPGRQNFMVIRRIQKAKEKLSRLEKMVSHNHLAPGSKMHAARGGRSERFASAWAVEEVRGLVPPAIHAHQYMQTHGGRYTPLFCLQILFVRFLRCGNQVRGDHQARVSGLLYPRKNSHQCSGCSSSKASYLNVGRSLVSEKSPGSIQGST